MEIPLVPSCLKSRICNFTNTKSDYWCSITYSNKFALKRQAYAGKHFIFYAADFITSFQDSEVRKQRTQKNNVIRYVLTSTKSAITQTCPQTFVQAIMFLCNKEQSLLWLTFTVNPPRKDQGILPFFFPHISFQAFSPPDNIRKQKTIVYTEGTEPQMRQVVIASLQ